jgi:hypothetical protein
MAKIDLKKELKQLYSAPAREVVMVDVPPMSFLMADGSGDPNTAQEYKDALEALYAVAYTLKFTIKKQKDIDYGVMPLEGLWWMDDMTQFGLGNKDQWKWTAMIMQPDYVNPELFARAVEDVRKKKDPRALTCIRLEEFGEGLSAQLLHIGPYSAEKPTIDRIHGFISDKGYMPSGKHHEIYLGDPRRSAPEKLQTIVRQPVKKK